MVGDRMQDQQIAIVPFITERTEPYFASLLPEKWPTILCARLYFKGTIKSASCACCLIWSVRKGKCMLFG